jgi:hypothetical protein
VEEEILGDDYFVGCDCLGAETYYGPESPEDLSKANRVLTPAEQTAVTEWKTSRLPWYQKDAFAGLKVWQAGLAGLGAAGIVSGVLIAAFGGKRR